MCDCISHFLHRAVVSLSFLYIQIKMKPLKHFIIATWIWLHLMLGVISAVDLVLARVICASVWMFSLRMSGSLQRSAIAWNIDKKAQAKPADLRQAGCATGPHCSVSTIRGVETRGGKKKIEYLKLKQAALHFNPPGKDKGGSSANLFCHFQSRIWPKTVP